MVVHAGEAEILEGQKPKLLYRLVDSYLAVLDLLQQLSQLLRLYDRVLNLWLT
jgi:hypothetical protein